MEQKPRNKFKLFQPFGILIFLFFLSFNSAFAQQEKTLLFNENWQNATTRDAVYKCECYFDSQNRLQGAFNCYNIKTEALVKQFHFTDDKLNGEAKEYYEDGESKLEATYKNGLPVGEWYEYDQKGRIKLHRTFDEQSRLIKDYKQEELTPYEKLQFDMAKKEEPPIYTSECLRLKIDQQKYDCSEQAIQAYISNPPIPPTYKNNSAYIGKTIQCVVSFRINEKGIVDEAEIIETTGDEFLDELAKAHVLNMVPFEAAKEYGSPINYWKDVIINFTF